MLKKLGELAQTDEDARMVLEDVTENDSRDAISRGYTFLEDYGKEDKPETPKDYTLTKDEEKRYKSLLLNNRDEFEDLLPQEKGYFYGTSPIDYDQRILFDEAERIRVNAETSISKEEALRRAFRIYGEEKAPVVEGSGWGIKKRG